MAKPSIFSSQYEREIKKRKKIRFFTVLILLVIAGVIAFGNLNKNNLNKISENIKKINVFNSSENKNNKNTAKSNSNTTKAAINTTKATSNTNTPKPASKKDDAAKEKIYSVKLEDGKSVNVFYDDSGSSKIIKTVDNSDPDVDYNISPNSSGVLIYEKSTQSMTLVKADGTNVNITKQDYTSSDGTVFNKNDILKSKPTYVWCTSPKFIDEDSIIYVTQLPWFNDKATKYAWIYHISNNAHENTNIQGTNIEIKNITDKGIEVSYDSNTIFLKGDGSKNN